MIGEPRTMQEILQGEDETEFLVKALTDFKFFFTRVLGMDYAPFYDEWIWAAENCKRVIIIAFTGSGKSSVMAVAYPLWFMLRNRNKEIMLTGQILEKPIESISKIVATIENNEMLKQMKPPRALTWMKEEIKTTNMNRVFARAYTEGIKGAHVDKSISDEISLFSPKSLYDTAIVTRVQRKNGNAIAITTPLMMTDLSMELYHKYREQMLKGNMDYFAKIYPAEANGVPLYPELYDTEKLRRIRKDLGEYAYYQQMLCSPIPIGTSLYPRELVEKCFDNERRLSFEKGEEPGDTYLGVDFAISGSAEAANSGYVGIKKLRDGRMLLQVIERQKGFKPSATTEYSQALNNTFKYFQIWVDEATFGPAYMEGMINAGLPVRGLPLNVQRYRNDILTNLRIQFERGNIIIPYFDDEWTRMRVAWIVNELESMAIAATEKNEMPTFKSHGSTSDLVMALALAVKAATDQRPYLDISKIGGF